MEREALKRLRKIRDQVEADFGVDPEVRRVYIHIGGLAVDELFGVGSFQTALHKFVETAQRARKDVHEDSLYQKAYNVLFGNLEEVPLYMAELPMLCAWRLELSD